MSKRSTDLKTTDSNPTGSNLINQQTTDSNAPELKTTSSNDSTGSKTSVSSETETIATTISPIDLSSAGAVARRLRMNAVHVLQDMQQLECQLEGSAQGKDHPGLKLVTKLRIAVTKTLPDIETLEQLVNN